MGCGRVPPANRALSSRASPWSFPAGPVIQIQDSGAGSRIYHSRTTRRLLNANTSRARLENAHSFDAHADTLVTPRERQDTTLPDATSNVARTVDGLCLEILTLLVRDVARGREMQELKSAAAESKEASAAVIKLLHNPTRPTTCAPAPA